MAGLSFAPPASPDRRSQQQNVAALSPTQQALQVLSLHLPRILGARALSPSALLAPSPGAASPVSPDAAVLQSALQAHHGAPGVASSPLAPAPAMPTPVHSAMPSPAAQAVAALVQSALNHQPSTPTITPGAAGTSYNPPTRGEPITASQPPPPAPAPTGGPRPPIRSRFQRI